MNKGITAKLSTLALAICAIIAPSAEIQASPIVYIFTAVATGATDTDSTGAGGTAFTDEAVTFSIYGDSDDIVYDSTDPATYSLTASSATLQIGSDLTTLSDTVTIYTAPDYDGIGTTVDGDLYFLATSSDLDGYDLSTSFGPIALDGILSLVNTVSTTSLGWVYISVVDPDYTGSFEAVAVPEPSTMLMASLAAGACLMTVVMRRRKEREVLA